MDSERKPGRFPDLPYDLRHLRRKRAAVSVAQDEAVRPAVRGGRQRLHGVLRVPFVPVEKVLGVEEYFLRPFLQVFQRLPDGLQVLVESGSQRLGDVKVPRFSDHGDDGGFGGKERLHVGVLRHLLPHAAGRVVQEYLLHRSHASPSLFSAGVFHPLAGFPRPNALWSTRTASSVYFSSIRQEILISEVLIPRMLIPSEASVSNTFVATPEWERIAIPTMETLAILSSPTTLSAPISLAVPSATILAFL